jgi:hypothetical protein
MAANGPLSIFVGTIGGKQALKPSLEMPFARKIGKRVFRRAETNLTGRSQLF